MVVRCTLRTEVCLHGGTTNDSFTVEEVGKLARGIEALGMLYTSWVSKVECSAKRVFFGYLMAWTNSTVCLLHVVCIYVN